MLVVTLLYCLAQLVPLFIPCMFDLSGLNASSFQSSTSLRAYNAPGEKLVGYLNVDILFVSYLSCFSCAPSHCVFIKPLGSQ